MSAHLLWLAPAVVVAFYPLAALLARIAMRKVG